MSCCFLNLRAVTGSPSSCSYLLTSPAGAQAVNLLAQVGRAHEVLPLSEELLAVDSCWGKGSHFSSEVQPLIGCSWFSGWLHAQVH